MKLFVVFAGAEEEARFVVLLDGGDTVGSLRRRIASDFRAVFPGRPPLCFFRMASADGFYLTDAVTLSEVFEEGSTVTCHRADAEAAGAPLPDKPEPADVEDILAVFRAQVAYVARAACHAALKSGSKAAAEAMSVVLAMLLLNGGQLSEARNEALSALQRGLPANDGAALPAFVAAGGLFTLLGLLSPATRLDGNPEVLEGAARLLEQLVVEHGETLVPLLLECHPATVLYKLALDSRCNAATRQHALTSRRILERAGSSCRGDGRRPQSTDRSERLRSAGAAVAGSLTAPRLPPSAGATARAASPAPGLPLAASPTVNLRVVLDSGSDPELQRQALAQLDAASEVPEELRAMARAPRLAEVLFRALRGATSQRPERASQLAPLGRILGRLARDSPSRTAFTRHLAEFMLVTTPENGGSGSPRELAEVLRAAWPSAPQQLRTPLVELLRDALLRDEAGSSGLAPAQLPSLLASLMEAGMPEDIQAAALRALCTAGDPAAGRGGGLFPAPGERMGRLNPQVINAALLRLIQRQPLLCLNVLAALALKEDFRSFFGSQASLLQFLAHCCQKPGAVSASAAPGVEAATLQRAAARCLANLSPHPVARDWARRSASLWSALSSAEDAAVRAYLGAVLGDEAGLAGSLPLRGQ